MMKRNVCVGWLVGVVIVSAALVVGCGGDGGGGGGQEPQATGSVTGTIIHGGTGLALGGIDVSIGDVAGQTDSEGTFTLAGVEVGQQALLVTPDPNRDLVLFPPGAITVVVEDGQTTELDAPIILIDAPDLPPNPPS